jgi:hypothetical protein
MILFLPRFSLFFLLIKFKNDFAVALLAQETCPGTNYAPCREQSTLFYDTTCVPLSAKNATWVNVCECYKLVNEANCFLQCPDNKQIQTEYKSFIGTMDAKCRAVGLDYRKPLPAPPVWQSNGLPVTGTTDTPTGSSPGDVSNSPIPSTKSNAAAKHLELILVILSALAIIC